MSYSRLTPMAYLAWTGSLLSLLAFAYSTLFLELYLNLMPCILCITERSLTAILFVLFTLLALHLSYLHRLPKLVSPQLALIGFLILVLIGVTLRHVTVQFFPDPTAACLPPSLDHSYLIQLLSYFVGEADCGMVQFRLFGVLPISVQVLVLSGAYSLLWVFLVLAFVKQRKGSPKQS